MQEISQQCAISLPPLYRDLSGNLHGFNKRWFFVLPVVSPSVISTIGGGGAAQRNMFYFPGAFDFDPNLLGWYATEETSNLSNSSQVEALPPVE